MFLLKRTLYGTCQAAIQFWKKLCGVMALVDAQRSKADVCLFFQWTAAGLLLYMSWVDDIFISGKKEDVLRAKRSLAQHFTLHEQGEMFEYVGCKVEHNRQQSRKRTSWITIPFSFWSKSETSIQSCCVSHRSMDCINGIFRTV
jgi:hypothetical protein